MNTARKLAVVKPAPKPRLRRVTMEQALRCHPNPEHAKRWLKAVNTLRTRTKHGWQLDTMVPKQEVTR